jgi:hypothetical protein
MQKPVEGVYLQAFFRTINRHYMKRVIDKKNRIAIWRINMLLLATAELQ